MSALWVTTENIPQTGVVVINGVTLKSFVQNDGKAVSAGVPKAIYEKAGVFPMYIQDQKTNSKSNEVNFTVR